MLHTVPHAVTSSRPRLDRAAARQRIVDAAIELVRERSFAELTVGEIMERAGLERTVFYRHFENVGALLLGAGREAIDELYAAQVDLAASRGGEMGRDAVERALVPAVALYAEHGPLLRAVSEAIAANQLVAVDQEMLRRRFDGLLADAIRASGADVADPDETARALNLLNEAYLLEAFGREPRVDPETARRTLAEIWSAVLARRRPG
jgi:AcrR family transcriptional regulator